MKKMFLAFMATLLMVITISESNAAGPRGKDFGFGIMLGDPVGISINYYVSNDESLAAYLGASYFGGLRVGADYLFHFDAFNSKIVKMYAGPGLAFGFGRGRGIIYKENKNKFYYWEEDDTGIGARVIFGINIIPRRAPLEIFFEVGPLIGITPGFGVNVDASVGIRFYP
ncbi:MAG: hypothetical protein CVV22_04255 [Ignavibacteriae bacterium HGW-Ignavibacteriae-1]|jgi:hypothetical protein|nr:MAG: hypothetical protein CVV22_04255 [Ignavibacteriae bacterium HGW-Ignavibacteriae-1]